MRNRFCPYLSGYGAENVAAFVKIHGTAAKNGMRKNHGAALLKEKIMLTSICGINWGDEGKGRMVDLLSEDYDIVCRYQGGNNAGHTVVNDLGKFALNLLPSGILRKKVVNVLGNGMVIDLKHLCGEMDKLHQAGVEITPDNL